jgi:hypothetical protein
VKWKLYQLCCLYNILIVSVYTCIVLFFFVKEPVEGLDDFLGLFLILISFAAFFFKNLMGNRLCNQLKNNISHTDSFGLGFYLLWLVCLVLTLILIVMLLGATTAEMFTNLRGRKFTDIILISSLYLLIATSVYTLVLDIPIERKIRKQYNIADGLLKDEQ